MQKLLFFFTLLIPFWLSAQNYVIQGTVSNSTTGAPIPNHQVDINSNNGNFFYSNSVFTDVNGFYSDTISIPSTVPQAVFIVSTLDCNNVVISYTTTYFATAPNPAIVNILICSATSTGCQAYYSYTLNGNVVNFTNQSQGTNAGTIYTWDFGNGQTSNVLNPVITYAQSGYYSVCLSIYDSLGCQSTYCDTLYINATGNCMANFTATTSGNTATFTNASTGTNPNTTYAWDFGDGTTSNLTNPNHTYSTSGNYYVCLTISVLSSTGSTCTDTYCQYVTIGSTTGCQAYFTYGGSGGTISFQNQSTPSGYFSSWDFGNGQTSSVQHPTYTYMQTGWYNVCLFIYDSTGCQSTYCDSIYVNVGTTGNCAANFSFTVSGNTVAFSNLSTGINNTTIYAWDFGDATTGNTMNPNHTYTSSGTYYVCLTITTTPSTGGTPCTSMYCQYVTIGSSTGCQAYFTYGGSGGTISFQNQSQGGSFYSWDFGNGQTSNIMHPNVTYSQPGYYLVCLTISDTTGCQDTYCDSVYVGSTGGCQAYFTYTVNGGVVTFQNQSTLGSFNNWNFGNGQTSSVLNPVVTYSQTGWYNVCLFIYDSTGCQSNYCDSIYVNVGTTGNCAANFSFTVSGNTVAFSNLSTGINNTTIYAWDFGDGTTGNTMNPNHTYTSSGTYYVCLTITTISSTGITCTSMYCQYVTIGSTTGCQAYFTYSANGGVVSFQNQSSGGSFYNWSFGNGQTSSAANPIVTYTQTGWYNVCLTVYDSTCQSTYCDSVYVNVGTTGNCQANFSYTVSGNTVAFSNLSTGINNTTIYAWDFGDATTGNTMNPNHTYTSSGTYYVCLTITTTPSTGGTPCTSMYCQYVTIGSTTGCQAYFTYSANGGVVSFQNQSQGGSFYNWSFGNGQTSSAANPTVTYTQTGWYNVCLTVYDSTCQSTYCDSVYVTVGTVACQANFTATVNGNVASFTNTSTGGTPNTLVCTWNFGDGTANGTTYNATHTYTVPGVYTVCLYILNSQNGCTDTFCQVITIPNSTGNCSANFTYQIIGTSGGVTFGGIATGAAPFTYTWAFGDGTNSIQQNPTHNYAQSANYIVCLTITDSTGCIATHCDSLNMTILGIENAFVSNISELYPNPTQGSTGFNIDLKEKANISIEVLNMVGQRIGIQNMLLSDGNHQIAIPTENLAQGMYWVKIAAEGQVLTTKRLVKE